ncbi:MAG: hypothetical protein A2138_10000 [Deltaproteobacteria bacterium RBG_16_71_12]|nr:MAG: hypothetical protein A2138_10000 [Deltaproteobacteria bacterium RBG_16_71_12]
MGSIDASIQSSADGLAGPPSGVAAAGAPWAGGAALDASPAPLADDDGGASASSTLGRCGASMWYTCRT